MKDKDYELSTEPKPNPMNIENLQEWMDMPLGSCIWLPGCDILRVPGGWCVANTRLSIMTSVFVPEPKKEKYQKSPKKMFNVQWYSTSGLDRGNQPVFAFDRVDAIEQFWKGKNKELYEIGQVTQSQTPLP